MFISASKLWVAPQSVLFWQVSQLDDLVLCFVRNSQDTCRLRSCTMLHPRVLLYLLNCARAYEQRKI